jgi:MFS family permease
MSILARPERSGAQHETTSLTLGTLIAAAIGVCAAQVAAAIPAVIQGLLQADIGPSASQLTWVSDAFLIPITLLELSSGVLSDRFGRKRLLAGGALLLAIGEGLAVVSPGSGSSTDTRMAVLWAAQALGGIGAAAMFQSSLAMVASGTHTLVRRTRSVTIWAAALSAGGLISPVISGLVANASFGGDANAGWRWAFLAVMLLALISAAVTIALARPSKAPGRRALDWPGQILFALTVFPLLLAVIQGPTSGWSSSIVLTGFAVAACSLVAFIVVERRSTSPLLRLDFFKNPAFTFAAIVTVLSMFAFLGTAYATSIRLSVIQGMSPLKTSIAFVLLNGIALVQAPVTARLLVRFDPKWPLTAGCLFIAAGDLWAASVPITRVEILYGPFALVGIGFALSVTAVTAVTVNLVPSRLAGMASGTTNLLRDFGFTLGPAVVGGIALSRAASLIHAKVAATPALARALAAFNQSPAHAPAAQRGEMEGAVHAVNSSPLGANGVPATIKLPNGHVISFNPIKDVAFHALGSAYATGFVVCGLAAATAALLAAFGMSRRRYLRDAADQVVDEGLMAELSPESS